MSWNGRYHHYSGTQIQKVSDVLFKEANTTIANKVVAKMQPEEILERLGDIKTLSPDIQAQLLVAFPKTRKLIDVANLKADHRVIILCNRPTVDALKKFDWNAKDLKLKHFEHVFKLGNNKIVQNMYENISDEKLALFGTQEWEKLLGFCRNAARRLDIKTIRNQSHLRALVRRKPHIMNYATIEDMQECVIDAPTWIRIITQMPVKDRRHIPAGFTDWVKRDVFKHKLKGRKFKNFAPDWMNGLQE